MEATTRRAEHRKDLAGQGRSGADMATRRPLLSRQPLRALVLCLAYAFVVAAAFVVLSEIYRPAMAIFFAVGLAALLSVPLAVLIPVPRHEVTQSQDARPVLQRGSTKRPRSAKDSPSAG
jgi:drug/metabolite transporter (DMT)-like permease